MSLKQAESKGAIVKIGIVGAGITGLTAAYVLADAGHEVSVYEAAAQVGGLASGFRDSSWEWPLERFYHHIFQTDKSIIDLTKTIGFEANLFFRSPITAQWWQGQLYPIDSPLNVLRFPALPFQDRVRFGLVVAYLKYLYNDWHTLEQSSALEWSQRWMGKAAYQAILQPLLEGKFGDQLQEVNMAWLWARFRARSFKLGYFEGGFQGFVAALQQAAEKLGVKVYLNAPVEKVENDSNGWLIHSAGAFQAFERLLITSSPHLLTKLVPQLPPNYLGKLNDLRSMGAVVLVLALKQSLVKDFYWIHGMPKAEIPFLALVEHTNFIEKKHYGGDHLVYCGDYLAPNHEYFSLSQDELLARFLPALSRFNANFQPAWIRNAWLQRETYAQPIVGLKHSERIPPLATPLSGLYWASMSQVYPWDRGTNFAVDLGQKAAREICTSPLK